MAYDEGVAEIMREALVDEIGVTERKMFGGLCFLLHGNMICGVHKDGAMFRVGKPSEAEALCIDGTGPMTFTGRPMGGMVDANLECVSDDQRMAQLMRLSLTHAKTLPPK